MSSENQDEIKRIKRVSSQMCSMHSSLEDSYKTKALILNLSLTSLSGWLVSLTFIGPMIGNSFNPTSLKNEIFFGIVSVITFILSLFELKLGFKEMSSRHSQSKKCWFKVLQNIRLILNDEQEITKEQVILIQDQVDSADDHSLPIPSAKFLKLKKEHLLKIKISKQLDSHPGLIIWLYKVKIIFKDTF